MPKLRLNKYKFTALFTAAFLGLTACSDEGAEAESNVHTPKHGSASHFSEEGITALEARMAQFVSDGDVRGIATRLVHKGKVISDFKSGVRKLESAAPIEDDTIYRIFSMTKPVTGVAMMMLWEANAFDLNDPITKYIPEFEGMRVIAGKNSDGTPILVDANRAPTMREVMSHTAGYAYAISGDDIANVTFRERNLLNSADLKTFIDEVAKLPLVFQPGDKWSYSAAVDIQGYVIEKLSGQSLGEFFETRIFSPLGMVDTGFFVPESDYERLSEIYGYDSVTGKLNPLFSPSVQYRASTLRMESGGGGLVSTMDDYARFSQMLLNNGELDGVRLLKADTVKLMATNVLPDNTPVLTHIIGATRQNPIPGLGFGLDVAVVLDSKQSGTKLPDGSYFWTGAAGTWFWIDPVNDLYFIGMVQFFNYGPHAKNLNFIATSSDFVYAAKVSQKQNHSSSIIDENELNRIKLVLKQINLSPEQHDAIAKNIEAALNSTTKSLLERKAEKKALIEAILAELSLEQRQTAVELQAQQSASQDLGTQSHGTHNQHGKFP